MKILTYKKSPNRFWLFDGKVDKKKAKRVVH